MDDLSDPNFFGHHPGMLGGIVFLVSYIYHKLRGHRVRPLAMPFFSALFSRYVEPMGMSWHIRRSERIASFLKEAEDARMRREGRKNILPGAASRDSSSGEGGISGPVG